MAEPKFSDWRGYSHEGDVYVFRDILHASGEFSGQCQYAVRDGDNIAWKPCVEGVLFADVEPLLRKTV